MDEKTIVLIHQFYSSMGCCDSGGFFSGYYHRIKSNGVAETLARIRHFFADFSVAGEGTEGFCVLCDHEHSEGHHEWCPRTFAKQIVASIDNNLKSQA